MIIIKNQTIHEMIVNVESSTFTVNPPLDIHQGDTCSHVMLIKLRNNEDFISIDKDVTYKMFYYLTKDKHLIETSDVTVINYYRGVLSQIVSSKVVEEFGSYTCYLRGYLGEEIVSTVSFPIVISKTHDYEAKSNEVIITKEFYNELKKHLNNDEIHLSEEDRDFLDTFSDQIEELSQVIKRDQETQDYSTDKGEIVPFTEIPEGLSILTDDSMFSEKDGKVHVINSPANINHTVEDDTNYISIISSNEIALYKESPTTYKYNSLSDITVTIEVDDHLDLDSENPVQNKVITKSLYDLIVNDPSQISDITKIYYDDSESNVVEVYTTEESDEKFAPKSVIVTDRNDITDDTEVFNDIDNQDRIVEVYTTDEADEKINHRASEVIVDDKSKITDNTQVYYEDDDNQIEVYTSKEVDTLLENNLLDSKEYTNQQVSNEALTRYNSDNNLQSQIDAITVSSDVVDVVGTYAELQNYDTSGLTLNDVIEVLSDETHNDAISYYRWVEVNGTPTWGYIGSKGPYYTKAEVNEFLNNKLDKNQGIENAGKFMKVAPDGSVDYEVIQKEHNYSTNEQVIGTWIDGKPIYELTGQFESGAYQVQLDVSIDTLIDLKVGMLDSGYKQTIATCSGTNSRYANISSSNLLYVNRGGAACLFYIIQYTKTTDMINN